MKAKVRGLNKAYKFRLYPNNSQKEYLAKTFGCTRFIYNRMLTDKIKHYEQTGEMLKNTPAQYKEAYPWLKEVDSLALANAQLNLDKAYKNFFRNKSVGFPKFKSKKHNRFSYTTNNLKGSIRLENGCIKLPKIGFIKIKQHREIPKHYILKSATISRTPTGKYFVAILFEYEECITPLLPEKIVGLDFSMRELFVSSDAEFANYPRYYRQSLKKLAKEQRKLSKCEKGSKNRNKQRIKVAKYHERVSNQRKDFLHKLSRKIANSYDVVAIEDLSMKGMSQALNFGKSVSDNGWGMFTTFLNYKLLESGKQLVKIDRFYPSSKTCSNCGIIKKDLSLADRIYSCECGFVCDRDINAAINIKNQGKLLIA